MNLKEKLELLDTLSKVYQNLNASGHVDPEKTKIELLKKMDEVVKSIEVKSL